MTAARLLFWLTIVLGTAMVLSGDTFEICAGMPKILRYLSRLWPPDFRALPGLLPALWQTVKIALFGTTLGFLSAIPLAFAASWNMTQNGAVYLCGRAILLAMRSIPAMILGILFVAAVGLGSLAGIMGVWIYSGGVLGKLLSENLEATDPEIMDAAAIDGANRFRGYLYIFLPMQANAALSFLLYRFESSFRQATLMGVAGAGGLGLELTAAMGLFDYGKTSMIVCIILFVVLSLDLTSRWLRGKVL
jgi:phosphonate transport system permease protein